jgi:hypothetical protein
MLKLGLIAAVLAVSASANGQVAPAPAPLRVSPSLYAINSAALASAMTYCSTKHGNLLTGSPGQACFAKARQILASYGLKKVSAEVDARCNDPATFNTCLTPEVGKLVYALNAEFVKQDL